MLLAKLRNNVYITIDKHILYKIKCKYYFLSEPKVRFYYNFDNKSRGKILPDLKYIIRQRSFFFSKMKIQLTR